MGVGGAPAHRSAEAALRAAALVLTASRVPLCSAQLAEGETCDPSSDECDTSYSLACADDGTGGYSCQRAVEGCCGVELAAGETCDAYSTDCDESSGLYCYDPYALGDGVCTPDCCESAGAACDL
eukprot:COSAG06_NODE_17043_length_965_cov_1.039261_1_plen_124_part_10